MKRSNIIVLSTVLLLIAWFIVSGWLQANAYNRINSQRTCNYVETIGNERRKSLNTFRNLKIDFEKHTIVQDISFSKNMNKQYSYKISGDTLSLSINYDRWRSSDYVNIGVPVLNNVKITSSVDDKWSTNYNDNDHNISITGFKANVMSIIFNSKYELKLENNRLGKLELKGNYYNEGKINIANYPDYDSLDIDIEGNNGTLVMSKTEINDNKKQWISIKVPQTFNIEAEAGSRIWKDITIKKSHHEILDQ
jgi:hypothetical protein